MHIESLLDHVNKLPTIPRVAQQVIASFGKPDISVGDIARQLSADPALSAKVLQLANSSYFQVSRSIGTLDDALKLLGLHMVRNLVLSNSIVAVYRHTTGLDMHQFWRYNLYTACAARWLARRLDANPDMVFTLGLLHAIGILQMHAAAPSAMVSLDKAIPVLHGERALRERQALGFHYGDVSAALALQWNLPPELAQNLRDIPVADTLIGVSGDVACVHLGCFLARAQLMQPDGSAAGQQYPVALAAKLGLGALADGAQQVPDLSVLTEGLEDLLE